MDKIWYIEFDTACDPGHSSGDKEVKIKPNFIISSL